MSPTAWQRDQFGGHVAVLSSKTMTDTGPLCSSFSLVFRTKTFLVCAKVKLAISEFVKRLRHYLTILKYSVEVSTVQPHFLLPLSI